MLSRLYADRLFPSLHDLSAGALGGERTDLLSPIGGAVLEIGVGSGLNLACYDAGRTTGVVGIDPAPGMLSRARSRSARVGFAVRLLRASAEHLPFPDGAFDAAVATLVFCTIPDPLAAAREVRRVLRAGGVLHVLEHVRSPRPGVARWQTRLTPLWQRCAVGCHLDRDTASTLAEAGFDVRDVRTRTLALAPSILASVISGRATREAS
ncbi:MAG: methyltransferase domain-containing protein [Acidobacteriota bacterium]